MIFEDNKRSSHKGANTNCKEKKCDLEYIRYKIFNAVET